MKALPPNLQQIYDDYFKNPDTCFEGRTRFDLGSIMISFKAYRSLNRIDGHPDNPKIDVIINVLE